MKTYKFIVFLVLITQTTLAQIGIGTTSPNAILDIRSSNQGTPNNNDGILIPKVDEFPLTNPTVTQDGMMVFVTGNGTPEKGFYYWDDTAASWISATGVKRIDDLIDGRSDSDGTDDGSSIFLGVDAGLNDNGTNNQNIGIGFGALLSNTNGFRNIAIGNNSLNSNTTGTRNTAIGYLTLNSNVDGNGNTAIGYRVLENNISGTLNSGLGFEALQNNTLGNSNTAVGYRSLRNNNTGFSNSALGNNAGSSVNGSFNTFIGVNSGFQSTIQSIDGSVMIGYDAGQNELNSNRLYIENSNADTDNALLYGEFDNNVLRTNSQFQIGNPTLTGFAFPTVDGILNQILQTDGSGNLNWADPSNIVLHSVNDLIDGKSDSDGTEDGSSIFLGIGAGSNDDGNDNANVGLGYQALFSNTTGRWNVANGYLALFSNIAGYANTAVGERALTSNTSGLFNTGIGFRSLLNNEDGTANVAVGTNSLLNNTVGASNVAIGQNTLFSNTVGNFNTAVGYGAGCYAIGGNNVFLGHLAGTSSTLTNRDLSGSVFLGFEAGTDENQSNRLYIENSDSTAPLIYGEFDNDILGFNAMVGIGTQSPSASLHINHPNGSTSQGMVISNQVDADDWRIYHQWNSNTLALFFNNTNVGNFDDVSGVYTAISDRNLKSNVSNIFPVLEKIQTLQVVDYNFKFQNDSKKYVGLIAQDVEAIFPHLVVPPNEKSENYTMDYSGFGVLAIKAIQEQQEEIESLKNQLLLQQDEISKIKEILNTLKK